jgi:uncharacterized protein
MSLKSIFFPENKKFFVLFDEVATHLKEMSKVLLSAVTDDKDKLTYYVREAEELGKQVEVLTHKLSVELNRNFITPFDREDIHFMAKGLNSIASHILSVTRQLKNYKISTNGITRTIAGENYKVADMLAHVLNNLRNMKSLIVLSGTCADIKRTLYDCDNLLDRSIADLTINQELQAIEVIKKMDHFEALQRMLESTGDTINVIESVIIKYG